jgi:hypothetical protein
MEQSKATNNKSDIGVTELYKDLNDIPDYERERVSRLRVFSEQNGSPVILISDTDLRAVKLTGINGSGDMFGYSFWKLILTVALRHNWEPKGTTLDEQREYKNMCGHSQTSPEEAIKNSLAAKEYCSKHNGCYFPRSYLDHILIWDTAELADALERCLKSTPLDTYLWLIRSDVDAEGFTEEISSQRDFIQYLIDFLRGKTPAECDENLKRYEE